MLLQGNQGQTGKQVGQNVIVSLGETGDALVTELQPRYYENSYRGNIFSLTYASATLSAVSTNQGGAFVLYNPVNSGKNLVMLDYIGGVAITTTIAATSNTDLIVVLGGFAAPQPTGLVGALTPTPTLIGSGNHSVATGYINATLAGNASYPAVTRQVQNANFSATVPYVTGKDEIAGIVIVPPGCGVNLFAQGNATLADYTLIPTLTWAEIPV